MIEPLAAMLKLLAVIASIPGFRWLGGLMLDLLMCWKCENAKEQATSFAEESTRKVGEIDG